MKVQDALAMAFMAELTTDVFGITGAANIYGWIGHQSLMTAGRTRGRTRD